MNHKLLENIEIKKIYSSLLVFLLFFFLLKNNLLIFYISPIRDIFGEIVNFGDWTVIINAAICFQQGIDVYNSNACDLTGRAHVYGTILLYMPFVNYLYEFYISFLPWLIVFFIIFLVHIFFSPKKIWNYLIIIGVIFSTPLVLAIERLNFEVVIFFFLILISFISNSTFQKIIIIFLSTIKFYPAALIFFFFNKKINIKSLISNLLFIIIIIYCFFLDRDQILNVLTKRNIINPSTVDNVGMLIFSFYGLPELAKSTILHLSFFGTKQIILSKLAYNFFLLLAFFFLIFFIFISIKKFNRPENKFNINFDHGKFEDKLFILSCIMILTIYFLSMNYIYKEIYFLGLLPFLIKKITIKKMMLFRILYYIILIKFIFLSLLWIVQIKFFSTSIYVKAINILIKNIIDLYLVSILLYFFFFYIFKFIILNFSLVKKNKKKEKNI